MDVGFKTDKGIKRSNNEDAFFVMKNDGIYIVADGVGGNRSGEIASRTAVSEIARYIEQHALGNREWIFVVVRKIIPLWFPVADCGGGIEMIGILHPTEA